MPYCHRVTTRVHHYVSAYGVSPRAGIRCPVGALRRTILPVLSPVLRWQSAGAGAGNQSPDGAPRDRSCARRKARGRRSFRAVARGIEMIAFNARSGPFPLPPVCAWVGCLRGVDAWGMSTGVRSFGGRLFGCGGRRLTDPGGTWVVSESPDSERRGCRNSIGVTCFEPRKSSSGLGA
jgi:hypothetical protein